MSSISRGARCDESRTPGSEGGANCSNPTYIIMCYLWGLYSQFFQGRIIGFIPYQGYGTLNF